MRRLAAAVGIATLCCVLRMGAQSPGTPDALATALDQRYKTVRDFSADFVQTYRGGALRTLATERGTVRIKKPGLMRWLYQQPEKKEFVADGHTLYSYFPADRQVMVSRLPADLGASTPALFLAGTGDLTRDFVSAFAQSPVTGTVGLKLTPRRPEGNVDYFVVAIGQPGFQIRGLLAHDAQGGDSTLTFSNLKENQGISDKEFTFRIPKGVDVVTNGSGN
jgi:outer membrane lipoprotein carrier protein